MVADLRRSDGLARPLLRRMAATLEARRRAALQPGVPPERRLAAPVSTLDSAVEETAAGELVEDEGEEAHGSECVE